MFGPCAFAGFVRSVDPYPPQFWVMIWAPPVRSALPRGSGEWGTHSCTQLSVRANPPPPPPSSTITQYEYYSPLTPDDVRVMVGTTPRTVFSHTGFRRVRFSYVFLTIRL